MKNNISAICLVVIFLFISAVGYGQLNQFLIGSYKYNYRINDTNYLVPLTFPDSISALFQRLKNSGINTLAGGDEWTIEDINKASLNGLKIIPKMSYFSTNITNPNVIGFDIGDEPKPSDYNSLVNFANQIRNANSNLLIWSNMLPGITQTTDFSYRDISMQQFINIIKPNILSFDQYPIFRNNRLNISTCHDFTFFRTLYDFGIKSVENSIPFFYVLTPIRLTTASGDWDMSQTETIEEFRYCIYAALTYGAKGIAYWPGFEWMLTAHETVVGETVTESDYFSVRTPFTNDTKSKLLEIHSKLNIASSTLLSLNFASAYHKSKSSTVGSPTVEQIHPFCTWDNLQNDKYAQKVFYNTTNPVRDWNDYATGSQVPDELAISFMTQKNSEIYFWLFNKSLVKNLKMDMRLIYQPHDVLNNKDIVETNIIPDLYGSSRLTYTIELLPGEAKLFKSNTVYSEIIYSITNYRYDGTQPLPTDNFSWHPELEDHLYPFESANQITLSQQGYSSTEPSVKFEPNSTKSFMAKNIVINPGVRIESGSTVRLSAYKDCNTIPTTSPGLAPRKKGVIPEPVSLTEPNVYPNPTRDNFVVKTTLKADEEIEIRVYDNVGRVVNVVKGVSEQTTISLGNQPAGIYFVRFAQHDKTYSYKVVKL